MALIGTPFWVHQPTYSFSPLLGVGVGNQEASIKQEKWELEIWTELLELIKMEEYTTKTSQKKRILQSVVMLT